MRARSSRCSWHFRLFSQAYSGAFLTTAALYAVFSVPAFVILSQPEGGGMRIAEAARAGAAEVIATARAILRHRDLRRFLGAYLLYEDGVNTVVAFSAIFAAQTLGFPMAQLSVLYIVVQASALIGALCWARPTDRLGPKRVVMITLCQWTAVVLAAFFVETQAQFWRLPSSRAPDSARCRRRAALLTTLVPPAMEGALFGSIRSAARARRSWDPSCSGGSRMRRVGITRGNPVRRRVLPPGTGAACSRARGRPGRSGADTH